MVDDGVAVVKESKGGDKNPEMIYGPKYGDKYNGFFYAFKRNSIPVKLSKEIDIIEILETQKNLK